MMPEAKLRLAMCELYKGNAENALSWIIQPIKYSLENRKALGPDPAEWTYFIVVLLCQGRLIDAIVRINQFSSLCHSELDWLRWVINCLQNQGGIFSRSDNQLSRSHYSVHQLPRRNFADWINNLCTFLQACQQFTFAEILINSASSYSRQQEKKSKSVVTELTNRLSSIRINYLKTLNNAFEKLYVFNLRARPSPILELEYILIITAKLAKPPLRRLRDRLSR